MIRTRHIKNPLEQHKAGVTLERWRPGLTLESLAPTDLEHLVVYRNGFRVLPDEYSNHLAPHDTIDFVEVPGFGAGAASLVNFIASSGASAASAAASASAFSFAAAASALAKLTAVAAVNFAIGRILGPSAPPLTASENDSPTYRFGGITSNQNAEGATLGVVYGEHDVGGSEIAKYSTVTSQGETLYVLLHLSEGPVNAVAGLTEDADGLSTTNGDLPEQIKINGQGVGNFDDVVAWVRMGADEQEAIPGFESATIQVSVDQTLGQPEDPGPGQAELAPRAYDPTDPTDEAELAKWDTAVTYDMANEADAFSAILAFPQGLFTSGGSGLAQNTVEFQARYQRLSGGVPTGKVAVLPSRLVSNSTSSFFGTELREDFVDPETYVAPTPGLFARIPSGGTCTISSPSGIDSVPAAQTEFSIVLWSSALNLSSFTLGSEWLFYWMNGSETEGFAWSFTQGPEVEGIVFSKRSHVRIGTGSGAQTYSTDLTATGGVQGFGPIRQIAAVYRFRPATQLGEVRIYMNGTLLHIIDTDPAVLSPTSTIEFARNNATELNLDDVRIFTGRALDSSEIAQNYNGGTGVASSGAEADIKVSIDFDTVTSTPQDKTTNNNDAVLASGAGISSLDTGIVPTSGVGDAKRDTYRIEIQRLTPADEDTLDQDEIEWEAVKLITYEQFRYGGSALLALRIRATDQLNGGAPTIVPTVQGRPCPVWDGVNAQSPTYTEEWTRNPAWIALDALTNREYGLGDYHDRSRDIDVGAFQLWADFCDELVDDGKIGLDLSDATTRSFTYTAGSPATATIVVVGVAAPPAYEVGDFVAIQDEVGVAADWNTDDLVGIELTSVDFDSATDTLTLVGNWPDGVSAPNPVSVSGIGAGQIIKREPRFLFDGVFDRPQADGWDAVVSIFQSARAQPVRYGNRVSVFIDRARDPVALVTMGNIVQGSFSTTYSGIKDRPNAVAIEILDREDGYERKLVEREHSTLIDPSNEENFRRRRIRREGVTRRSQALRECVYQLNVAFLVRRQIEFQLDVDGLLLQPGDRIQVSHDVPQWGFSGRLRAGTSATEFSLDREVVIDGAKTYQVAIKDADSGQSETRTISSGAGTYAAGSTLTVSSAFPFVPAQHDLYAFGETAQAVKDFAVTDVRLTPSNLRRTVQAAEYDEQVYADTFGNLLESPSALPVPTADQQVPEAAQALSASENGVASQEGEQALAIDVGWQNSSETLYALGRNEVWLEDEDSGALWKVGEVEGSATSYQIRSSALAIGKTFNVYLRPVGRAGRARSVRAGAVATVSVRGLGNAIDGPDTVTAKQAGQSVSYAWTGLQKVSSREVQVRAGGWILGQRLLQAARGAQEFGPTDAWVRRPVVAVGVDEAGVDLVCRARSGSGQWSPAARTTFTFDEAGFEEISARNFEPAWSLATLTDLATRSSVVEFSGSALSGTIEYTVTSGTSDPRWYWLTPSWEANQTHPQTWEDANFSWGDVDGQRWSWEGPVTLAAGETPNCSVAVEIATSQTGTPPAASELQPYSPGRRFFNTARVRLTFTRRNANYDVAISKAGYSLIAEVDDAKRGVTFPTSPDEGDRFYRTDLDEWFFYDGSRSKWLGLSLFEFSYFTIGAITGAYFLFDDDNLGASATVGYVAPFDLCCVGLSGMDIIPTTAIREVRDDGANVASVTVVSSTGAYRDMTLNSSTIAAGSILSLFSTGTSAASHHVAYFRRTAT